MEFNSFGPAVGRLGSDSSRGGANSAKVEAGGLSPLAPLTLTTVERTLLFAHTYYATTDRQTPDRCFALSTMYAASVITSTNHNLIYNAHNVQEISKS